MINILLTPDMIEGEPGPNFYWRGRCENFLQLVIDLHPLGGDIDQKVDLGRLDYVTIANDYSVVATSSKDGKSLVKIKENEIHINCGCNVWREILQIFLSISFYPSHNYVEIEDDMLIEDANFIVSSEG